MDIDADHGVGKNHQPQPYDESDAQHRVVDDGVESVHVGIVQPAHRAVEVGIQLGCVAAVHRNKRDRDHRG